MSVTKRTRYEVLRRDNFTCRYCRSAEGALTVDHVVPVALGGSDAPNNLVAACKDCNAGKSSSNPDGTLIEDVKQDALRHAEMIKQAYAVVVTRMGERDEYVDEFLQSYGGSGPVDWRNTINRWFEMGVPIELVTDAARVAMTRTTVNPDRMFAYLCGIVWKQVHAVNEAVELKAAIDGAFMTQDAISNERIESYLMGCAKGAEEAREDSWETFGAFDVYAIALSSVIDGTAAAFLPDAFTTFQGPQVDLTLVPEDHWARF